MEVIKKLIDDADLERERWLAVRKLHLTATDWPKITGSSKYGSAADVLLDKVGLAPEITMNAAMMVGKKAEAYINRALLPHIPQGRLESNPFYSNGCLGITPDLLLVDRPEGQVPLMWEYKTSSRSWYGKVPAMYRDQCQFQLAGMELPEVTVVFWQYKQTPEEILALMDDPDFEIDYDDLEFYTISQEPAEGEELRFRAINWFEAHVLFGEPLPQGKVEKPSWDGVELDPDLADEYKRVAEEHTALKSQLAQLEEQLNEAKAKVISKLEENSSLTLQGYGFAVERTFRAGSKKVAYEKVIKSLQPSLTKEQASDLATALEAATTYTKPSFGLTIKEA
jgi:regulator of replication initiation timing